MLDFEEELKNFKPSKEIDETADTINKRNKTDLVDIMMQKMKEKEE